MSGTEYEELMDTIRRTAARIFEYAETEEEVCRLEQPPSGWDPLGR